MRLCMSWVLQWAGVDGRVSSLCGQVDVLILSRENTWGLPEAGGHGQLWEAAHHDGLSMMGKAPPSLLLDLH